MAEQTMPSRVLAPRPAALALLIMAYAAFGSALEPRAWPAAVAVLTTAVAIAALSLRRFERSDDAAALPLRRGTRVWSVVIIAGLLWEAWAFFHQPAWDVANPDYPTLSVLIKPALELEVVRFTAWAAWLYAGLRLVRL